MDSDFRSLSSHDIIKQTICELANHFAKIWKDHRKTSPNPRRPNFNFDTLQQKLKDIIDENKQDINLDNKEVLINNILDYNNKVSIKFESNHYGCSSRMIDKCNTTNCYLFLGINA